MNMEVIDKRQILFAILVIELLLISLVLSVTAATPENTEHSSNAVDEAEEVENKLSVEERFNYIPPRVLSTMMRLSERGPGMFKNGDTVRAYTPTTHRICDDHVVSLFNLRLHPYSEVLQALDLHYYKMRSLRSHGDNFQAVIWAMAPNEETECVRLGTVDLHSSRRHGYQTTDITSEMADQFDSLTGEVQFGVSFSTDNNEDSEMSRSDAAVNTFSSRPFILIYTKQKHRTSIGTLQKSFHASVSRDKRSIIPDLDNGNHVSVNGQQQQQDQDMPSPLDPNQLSFEYFHDQNKIRRKMIRRQRRKQSGRHTPKNDDSDLQDEIANNELPLPVSERRCRRYPLKVKFWDIGWDDFIVAPDEYPAYYCAGTCSNPSKNNVSPTNHAAIMNVMNVLGTSPVPLPAPCCVPDKMASYSLLYFDRNDQIALQTFSNMQVVSCSCR